MSTCVPGWGPGHCLSPPPLASCFSETTTWDQWAGGGWGPRVFAGMAPLSPDPGHGGGGVQHEKPLRQCPDQCSRQAAPSGKCPQEDALGRGCIQLLAPIPDTSTTVLGELGQVPGKES